MVETIAVVALFAMLAILIVAELIAPARSFAEIPGWRLKCALFMPMIIGISLAVQWLFDPEARLLPGHRLGIVGGTIVGIVVSEFIIYWVHRLHHRVGFLWRWIHQLHHSAERVDVFGSAYFHPFEITEGAVVGVLLLNVVMGLAPEAAVLTALWQPFNAVFQHGNIATPVWLGYIVQRPEAHAIHHERGIHGYNYANLPLWDIAFGTFKNPRRWSGDVGFYEGSSKPTVRMLLGNDIKR